MTFLGYEPEWQDIFATEEGGLREMLRRRIDACSAVIQLVGQSYGFEPSAPDEKFGRVSYTQYEALYAREKEKKVWYLVLDENFAGVTPAAEAEDKRELQRSYRERIKADQHLYHALSTSENLETRVLKLRDELRDLRRGFKRWAAAVGVLLLVIAAATTLVLRNQHGQKQQLAAMEDKLTNVLLRLPQQEASAQQAQPGADTSIVRARVIEDLARQYGLDPAMAARKLPAFAQQLKESKDAPPLERASAAYFSQDFPEAERLALVAAGDAHDATPAQPVNEVRALTLAAIAAQARVEFASALRYLADAEKLLDRAQHPQEWNRLRAVRGLVLLGNGRFREAEETIRSVLPDYQRLAPDALETFEAENNLGVALLKQGRTEDAERQFSALLQRQLSVLGADRSETFRTRSNIAATFLAAGKFASAARELRFVLLAQQKHGDANTLEAIATRANLASALLGDGKLAEAETEYRTCLEFAEKSIGKEHPVTLQTRGNLAATSFAQGKYAEAEVEFRNLLKLQEKTNGPAHPDTLLSRANVIGALNNQGKYAEAEAAYRELIRLDEKAMGAEHPETLRCRSNLGRALALQGKFADAEAEIREVCFAQAKVLGPEHPVVLSSRGALASVLVSEYKNDEGAAEYGAIIPLQEKLLGPDHTETLSSRLGLADILRSKGDYIRAEAMYRAISESQAKTLGPSHPETINTRAVLANVLTQEGRFKEAVALDRERLATIIASDTAEADKERLVASTYVALSWHQVLARDFAGALESSELAKKGGSASLPAEINQAHALLLLGRIGEAEALHEKHRGEQVHGGKTWNEIILHDLDDLEKSGITHPEFARLRTLLARSTEASGAHSPPPEQ